MSETAAEMLRRTGNLYGSFAYAIVVVTSYVGFFFSEQYYSSEYLVPVVFILGAVFA